MSQEDGAVSILVKLSGQPSAASARAEDDALLVEIDGVALAPFSVDPPKGVLVRHVEGQPTGDGGSQLILSGAALQVAETIVYRNAVLVKARLLDARLASGSSLLAPPRPTPEAPAAAAAPPPAAAPHHPAPQTTPPVAPSTHLDAAALAGVSAERCAAAPAALQADQWDLSALGDHALCLLKAGKPVEAANRLDQLAAFQPEDWRVALGRAVLAQQRGDVSAATIGLNNASLLAPDEGVRRAIRSATQSLQPTAPHAADKKENPPGH